MATNNVRIFVLVLILGYFQTCHCASFFFGPTTNRDDACILVNMDAVFELSRTVDGKTEDAPMFNVSGAAVVRGRSICASDTSAPTMVLSLFPTQETFRMNFQTSGSSQVDLSFSLLLDPAQHFENSTGEPLLDLDSSKDLPAGEKNMSFKCDSVQTVVFNRDPTYKMTLTLTNFKAQAYEVFGGKFSQEEACDADKDTTSPSTTLPTTTTAEMETTAPTTNQETTTATSTSQETTTATSTSQETTSTKGPETTTQLSTEPTTKSTTATSPTTTNEPEPETTTPGQPSNETTTEPQTTAQTTEMTSPKPTPKYNVEDGGVVCIVLQGTIRFDFKYQTVDGKDMTTSVQIPGNAKTEGNCSISPNTQEIRLKFFKDTWTFTVEIAQDLESSLNTRHLLALEAENSYSWRKIQLDYVIDEERFPNATNQGNTSTVVKEEETGDFKASPQGSYQCNSGERVGLSEVVTLDLANFQYRAFGTTNETDFSGGEVSKCPADDGGDDDDDNDTLAIVLGSVFGGLGLIVIVIIVIHCARNRRKKHYETI